MINTEFHTILYNNVQHDSAPPSSTMPPPPPVNAMRQTALSFEDDDDEDDEIESIIKVNWDKLALMMMMILLLLFSRRIRMPKSFYAALISHICFSIDVQVQLL